MPCFNYTSPPRPLHGPAAYPTLFQHPAPRVPRHSWRAGSVPWDAVQRGLPRSSVSMTTRLRERYFSPPRFSGNQEVPHGILFETRVGVVYALFYRPPALPCRLRPCDVNTRSPMRALSLSLAPCLLSPLLQRARPPIWSVAPQHRVAARRLPERPAASLVPCLITPVDSGFRHQNE